MTYVIESNGWYLRGSVWAGRTERATQHDTLELATAALDAAKKNKGPGKMSMMSKKLARVLTYEQGVEAEVANDARLKAMAGRA